MSELRSVTCRTGPHSVTCHPTQVNTPRLNSRQIGRCWIYLPRRDCDLPRSHPVLRLSHYVQRWCAYTSVRAAQYPPLPTVPPLPWWAVELSGVTSHGHRLRPAPAADTFWPMVGWEFLPVKVLGRALLHQKGALWCRI